ncbi:GGDEF domain-containing protein [Catenovulum sp. SM1970]|uniref:GGDEF domain-containing protein n=1 Tax=Marinifaba aquimaris TaxID=2741323 RepID=UPI001573BF95|nr:GGDEF domain-containing protein [Marinifaba aquimaris]NTS76716.1 GGDEF domain-containing protein [Marinifaba aquimaris]
MQRQIADYERKLVDKVRVIEQDLARVFNYFDALSAQYKTMSTMDTRSVKAINVDDLTVNNASVLTLEQQKLQALLELNRALTIFIYSSSSDVNRVYFLSQTGVFAQQNQANQIHVKQLEAEKAQAVFEKLGSLPSGVRSMNYGSLLNDGIKDSLTLVSRINDKELGFGILAVELELSLVKLLLDNNDQAISTYLFSPNKSLVFTDVTSNITAIDFESLLTVPAPYLSQKPLLGQFDLIQVIDRKKLLTNSINALLPTFFIMFSIGALSIVAFYSLELKNQLKRLAFTDTKTELMNERAFKVAASGLINLAKRSEQKTSLVLCDIDNFHKVNQIYGHEVADKVMFQIGQLMLDKFRLSDIVSSYVGDEFLIALPNTELSDAIRLSEELRKQVEATSHTDKKVTVTVTLATAECKHSEQFEDVIKRLERALAHAKELGRNNVISA